MGIAMLKAQQDAFAKKGNPSEKDEPEVGRGNVAAERMAAIKAQQEEAAKKLEKNTEVGRGNVAAERMAQIKAQQEATAKKFENNTEVGRGNVAAERIAMLKAQQDAFAKKGNPLEKGEPEVGRGN